MNGAELRSMNRVEPPVSTHARRARSRISSRDGGGDLFAPSSPLDDSWPEGTQAGDAGGVGSRGASTARGEQSLAGCVWADFFTASAPRLCCGSKGASRQKRSVFGTVANRA